MRNRVIEVLGDPIVDIWRQKFNGGSVSIKYTGGAAFNILKNIEKLNIDNGFQISVYPLFSKPELPDKFNLFYLVDYPAKVYNYKTNGDINNIISSHDSPLYNNDCSHIPFENISDVFELLKEVGIKPFRTLIVADYNKGFVDINLPKLKDNRYDLCVIDSRYGNTNSKLLEQISHCLVYRKTKTDTELPMNWDYKIITDGSNPIEFRYKEISLYRVDIRSNNEPGIHYLTTEKSIIIELDNAVQIPACTVGAGDTFTSAIAFYLTSKAQKQDIKKEEVIDAIKFAIKCSQSVIKTFGTSTPEKPDSII